MHRKRMKHEAVSRAVSGIGGAARSAAGMTLIELLVTMAILALLVTLAWPGYGDVVRKGRRVDAVSALQRVQLEQARHYAAQYRYAESLLELGYADEEADSPQGHYRLRLLATEAPEDSYRVVAEPAPGSDQVRDACGAFALGPQGPIPGQPADPACWPR